jgi:hypothetical protein
MKNYEVGNGAYRARTVLRELHILRPSEIVIEAIAWRYGARISTGPLDGAEACMIRKGNRGTILIREGLDLGKYRFNAAHEIGHFLLHATWSLKACTEEDFLLWKTGQEQEREADDFAVNLLLPKEMFIPKIEDGTPSFALISQVARDFETSLTFTASRYVELTECQCALVVSSKQGVEWFKVSQTFPGWFEKRQRIDPDSHAYDVLQGTSSATGVQPVSATAWFPQRRWKDVIIREDALELRKYGKAMSLIWIPE